MVGPGGDAPADRGQVSPDAVEDDGPLATRRATSRASGRGEAGRARSRRALFLARAGYRSGLPGNGIDLDPVE